MRVTVCKLRTRFLRIKAEGARLGCQIEIEVAEGGQGRSTTKVRAVQRFFVSSNLNSE